MSIITLHFTTSVILFLLRHEARALVDGSVGGLVSDLVLRPCPGAGLAVAESLVRDVNHLLECASVGLADRHVALTDPEIKATHN